MDSKKKSFLRALNDSLGIITAACQKAKVPRSTFYNWMKEDSIFRNEAEAIFEAQTDFVESKLLENIKSNDTTAIIFYLKTKARDRGYSEKIDITAKSSKEVILIKEEAKKVQEATTPEEAKRAYFSMIRSAKKAH